MINENKVYSAGFIDGDGSISIYCDRKGYLNGIVAMNQKNLAILEMLCEVWQHLNPVLCSTKDGAHRLNFNGLKGLKLLKEIGCCLRRPKLAFRQALYQCIFNAWGIQRAELWRDWVAHLDDAFETIPERPPCEDLPWLAGFTDAEGCIYKRQDGFYGQVLINQNSEVLLSHIAMVAERQGLPQPRYAVGNNWQRLEFNRQKGNLLLQRLLPHMKHPEKKSKAETYVDFFSKHARKEAMRNGSYSVRCVI